MPLTPALAETLARVALAAAQAPHGKRGAIYAAATLELGISLPTLMRHLRALTVRPARKRRSDAGSTCLSLEDARLISAMLMESHRKNGKRLLSIGQAVEILRANGEVAALRVDKVTGHAAPMCERTISRALRSYGLHPEQLLEASPAVELKSLHPNHVWQIDASLCVLYYLSAGEDNGAGLQVMDARVFYKNKPANLKRIENERVWRYVVTDHNSGTIFLNYVLGAESGVNLAAAFIAAIQPREGDPFHGVPFILMMDMGSANTSGLFTNLTRRLKVRTLPHAPENARATGQVENAQNIVERSFESGLRMQPVADLAELNQRAQRWAKWFNSTKVHRRHGRTRYEQWMTIGPAELRLAPPEALCRELLTHAPERRKVSDKLRVSFRGQEFDVRTVPGVMVGEWLDVTFSPYAVDCACIVGKDAERAETLHTVPVVTKDDAGFAHSANVIGEDYSRHAETRADANRKAVELLAMNVSTLAEAAAARKAKAVPFAGRIDPHKAIEQGAKPTFLPRRGTALEPGAKVAGLAPVHRVLNHFQAAAELHRRGLQMNPERNAQVRAWYPQGVPEAELDTLERRLAVRAGLRVLPGRACGATE